jgi:hypothetical protein
MPEPTPREQRISRYEFGRAPWQRRHISCLAKPPTSLNPSKDVRIAVAEIPNLSETHIFVQIRLVAGQESSQPSAGARRHVLNFVKGKHISALESFCIARDASEGRVGVSDHVDLPCITDPDPKIHIRVGGGWLATSCSVVSHDQSAKRRPKPMRVMIPLIWPTRWSGQHER